MEDVLGPDPDLPENKYSRDKRVKVKVVPGKHGMKGAFEFLNPRLPGRFSMTALRAMPREGRQARYLQTYAATMGNHSLSRYYAGWDPAQFRREVEECPDFQQAIRDADEEIADRAKFVLYTDLGLVNAELPEPIRSNKGMSVVLARIVEDLRERSEQQAPPGRRSPEAGRPRKLSVPGLRDAGAPVPPVS